MEITKNSIEEVADDSKAGKAARKEARNKSFDEAIEALRNLFD